MKKKYKIALLSAYIGNGGDSGKLSITLDAMQELQEYDVDIYFFTNDDLHILQKLYEPIIKKEDIISYTLVDRIVKLIYLMRYKQYVYPSESDNYTRLLAKLPKMKFYKLIPVEKYDYYIWLDSKFTIEKHWLKYVHWLIENNLEADMIVSKHSVRNSIREELDFIVNAPKNSTIFSKYNREELAYQVYKYRKSPYFRDDKLYECGMIIYNKKILRKCDFLEEWYAHNFYYSIQDQLSIPYLQQKYDINIVAVVQNVMNMPFCRHEYFIK